MPADPGRWQPLSPTEVADRFRGVSWPWWIAGGWAIDLADTDVLVLRDDQRALREALDARDVAAAPPGSLRPGRVGEALPDEVHDVWCRRTPDSPWSLQLMVDDARDGLWTYRRDARVTRPVAELDGGAGSCGP